MNTQATKQFLNKSKGNLIAFIVFAALTVVTLAVLLFNMLGAKPKAEAITVDNEAENVYGYLDVELLTDWFGAYEDDSLFWHVAGTTDGNLYIVAMTKSVFENDYAAAFEYCYSDSETPPAAVRATGVMQPMDDELIEMGAEFMEWDVDTFKSNCGIYYLDTTMTPSAAGESGGIFIGLSILFGIFALSFGIAYFAKQSSVNKSLKRLNAAGELSLADAELSQPAAVSFDNGKVVFTDHFLANANNGVVAKYSDLLWAYVTVQRTNLVPTGQCLTVRTAQKQILSMAQDRPGKRSKGLTRMAIEELARRCPDILLGFTQENNVEYNNRVAAMANGSWSPAAAPAYSAPAYTAPQYSAPAPQQPSSAPAEDIYKDSDPTIR